MDPPIGGGLPASGTVVFQNEASFELSQLAAVFIAGGGVSGDAGDGEPLVIVGPAGQGHGLSVGEQFQVGGGDAAAETARGEFSEVEDALRGEVGDLDCGAGDRAEALLDGGIAEGLEADIASPEEDHGFVLGVAVRDGGGFGAAVLSGEFERLPAGVGAATDPDRDAVLGEAVFLTELADAVTGTLESGKRFGLGAFVGIFAVEGDPEFLGDFGVRAGGEECGASKGQAQDKQGLAGGVLIRWEPSGFRRHGFIKSRGRRGGKGFCRVRS
jgi:hypothetical protein